MSHQDSLSELKLEREVLLQEMIRMKLRERDLEDALSTILNEDGAPKARRFFRKDREEYSGWVRRIALNGLQKRT